MAKANSVPETAAEENAKVVSNANAEMLRAETLRKKLIDVYTNEEKVPRYLSPMYQAYFGKIMNVMINGISIAFRVDGQNQLIPQTFADEIDRRRMAVDAILLKQNKMADVPNNAESSPGELQLF